MPKPGELYLGVLDFFAVILPGAIAAAILEHALGAAVFGTVLTVPKSETAQWAAFLVSAYLLGHLIFLVGSWVDPLYGRLRSRFAEREYHWVFRVLGLPESLKSNQKAFLRATAIRDSLLTVDDRHAVNTFQWARAVLIAKSPAAAADVQRLEADSKFFRSFLVVSLLTGITCAVQMRVVEMAVAFGLIFPCFARYFERRLKSTTQAYIHIIALHALGGLTASPQEAPSEPAGAP